MSAAVDQDVIWTQRAERLLEAALSALRDENVDDVFSNAELALVCLRIEAGEMPADEVAGYAWPGEEQDDDLTGCICPPELLSRGGFKGRCPVHGRG